MRRWGIALAGLLCATAACRNGPAAPTPAGGGALRVQVVDETTGAAIVDPVFRLELHLTASGRAYKQPVVSGTAEFTGVVPDEYRLTTTALYGYLQLDFLTIRVEGEKTHTLKLAPIDDLGVERVLVDGREVPAGGSVVIPARGVTIRFRGRYQSPRSTWPAANGFSAQVRSATAGIDGVGHEGGATGGGPVSASEFDISIPNWTPCTRFAGTRLSECFTASDILILTMAAPFDGRFGGAPLIRKSQPWPLRFELSADCCLP